MPPKAVRMPERIAMTHLQNSCLDLTKLTFWKQENFAFPILTCSFALLKEHVAKMKELAYFDVIFSVFFLLYVPVGVAGTKRTTQPGLSRCRPVIAGTEGPDICCACFFLPSFLCVARLFFAQTHSPWASPERTTPSRPCLGWLVFLGGKG